MSVRNAFLIADLMNSRDLREALLWDAVRRCHARTNYYRLGDDPKARYALNEWEAAFTKTYLYTLSRA
jgi:hypothetical protein